VVAPARPSVPMARPDIGDREIELVTQVLRSDVLPVLPMPNGQTFHGYVTPWKKLTQEMKNALIRTGMADRRGRIL